MGSVGQEHEGAKVPASTLNARLALQLDSIADFLRQAEHLWLLTEMPGNIGDHLIWAGTERLLNLAGLDCRRISVSHLKRTSHEKRSGDLLIPGSGAFVSRFHEWLPALVIAASKVFDRVIVFPSQYDPNVPIVREALSISNVFPFAREGDSYGKIRQFGRAVLAHDPALWAMDFSSPTRDFSDMRAGGALVALRTDSGSILHQQGLRPAAHNNDISCTSSSLEEFLERIRQVETVVTDRLHVLVAGVMLGKRVQFVDPYDRKISLYVEYNFRDEFSDQVQQQSEDWLVRAGYAEAVGVAS